MPAAAVIPAPRMNIIVVAVKKLVAEFGAARRGLRFVQVPRRLVVSWRGGLASLLSGLVSAQDAGSPPPFWGKTRRAFTVSKSECSKQAFLIASECSTWDDEIRFVFFSAV